MQLVKLIKLINLIKLIQPNAKSYEKRHVFTGHFYSNIAIDELHINYLQTTYKTYAYYKYL